VREFLIIMYCMHIFRTSFRSTYLELISSPEHVITMTTREIVSIVEYIFLKRNIKSPFKAFDDNYIITYFSILTKKNFPYLQEVDMAILHFWENGFIGNGFLWVTDNMRYESLFIIIRKAKRDIFLIYTV